MKIIKANESHRDYVTSIIKMRWDVDDLEANYEFNRWLINDKDSICYIGLIDNKPIATGVFDADRSETEFDISPYNTLLWVEPKYRGNGYGKLLSEIRYEWALNHNYKVIYLDTLNAYDYHIKFGWTLRKEIIYNNKKYFIMQKILDTKLSFIQTRNIYDFATIAKPLADDFTAIFYHTLLVWCEIIPPNEGKSNRYWEVWLIKIGNKPIGICGLYTLQGATDTKELWLGWLGIIPEFRNLKLGTQIMEHLYVEAKKVGCKRIYSYVDKGGAPLNFYNREGFKVIGTVQEYLNSNNILAIDGDDFESPDDFVIMKEL